MNIKIKKLSDTATIPTKASSGAAGFDLYADIQDPVGIWPHETAMIPSNIAFEIPAGYFGAIYARSGLSTREGIRPATCVSVIDSDYRGPVGLPVHNDSDQKRTVLPQERIAQIVFQPYLPVDLEVVDELSDTERGQGGFGSTGR